MSLAPYPVTRGHRFQLSDTPPHVANSLAQLTHDHLPDSHWQPYFAKSSSSLSVVTSPLAQHHDGDSSSWRPLARSSSWIEHNSVYSSIHHGIDNVSRQSRTLSSPQGHYPESSQRTFLPSPPHPFTMTSNLLASSPPEQKTVRCPPDQYRSSNTRESALYSSIETSPGRDSRASSPSVKLEADDDGFVMEFNSDPSSLRLVDEYSFCPPTEVPLRATQASEEMRKMMGVFRLNPFTMHNADGRGTNALSWSGEEAGPLTEEPQLHEFQVKLRGAEFDSSDELRSFSPDFEIGLERDDEYEHFDTASNSRETPQLSPGLWPDRQLQLDDHLSSTRTSPSLDLDYPCSPLADHRQQGAIHSIPTFPAVYQFDNMTILF